MKKIVIVFLLVLISLNLVSCSQDNNKQNNLNDIQTSLNSKINDMQSQMNSLQKQVNYLSIVLNIINNNEAFFTPGTKGYESVKSNTGTFLISLDKISKYADGYQVSMNIGNPTLITFNGAIATIRWGKPYQANDDYQAWYNSLKIEKIEINKTLLPGIWNKIKFVLSPASADETGCIIISLQTDKIFLYGDLRKAGD